MVFLILAAQYEKWTLPIGVVLSVPFAIFGALVLRPPEGDPTPPDSTAPRCADAERRQVQHLVGQASCWRNALEATVYWFIRECA